MTSRRILEHFEAVSEDGTKYTILMIEESEGDGDLTIASIIFQTEQGYDLAEVEPETFEIIDLGIMIYKV